MRTAASIIRAFDEDLQRQVAVCCAGSGQKAKQLLLMLFAVATVLTIAGGVAFAIAYSHAEADRGLERTYSH